MTSTTRKQLIIVAGIYGAGKTTFIERHLRPRYQTKVQYLLPDKLVTAHGYTQGTPDFHEKIIEPMIQDHLTAGDSLLYETTLTSTQDRIEMPGDAVGLDDYLDQMPSDLDRMRMARKLGYQEIILYYLTLGNPEQHAAFVKAREATGSAPIEYKYIENRFRKSLRNLPRAITLADRAYLINNAHKNFQEICRIEDRQVVQLQGHVPQCLAEVVAEFGEPTKGRKADKT